MSHKPPLSLKMGFVNLEFSRAFILHASRQKLTLIIKEAVNILIKTNGMVLFL